METLKNSTSTLAFKMHKCDFCSEKIFPSEVYMKSTHKYEGQLYDWKTHKHCHDLADSLKMYENTEEGGVTQEMFMERVSTTHDDILIAMLPEKEHMKYKYIIQQIRYVRFREKLFFVIHHLKTLEQIVAGL